MDKPNGPKLSEKLGSDEFKKESSLTGGADSNTPEAGGAGGPQRAEGLKNAAAKGSEAVKDIKDIAKADATGVKSAAKEIKEGSQKGGAMGAAGATARAGAGQAAALAATALSGGALAKFQGKIATGVSKALKKENLPKVLLASLAILFAPLIVLIIVGAILVYFAANPGKFVSKVLLDPKARQFGLQAATIVPKAILGQEEMLRKYGYVDKRGGIAVAAESSSPKPGSIEEKMAKINYANAKFQTNSAPDCYYKFTTKEMVGPNGQKTSVIDKVTDKQGNEVEKDTLLVNYCIIQSMPIYNLMVRTQNARDVNKFSNTILNYADSKNSPNLAGKTPDEVKKYVHNKTYNRITSPATDTPKVGKVEGYDIAKKIEEIRSELAKYDGNPDSISFEFDGDPNSDKNLAATLCAFSDGYLTKNNLKKALYSRLNTGQRSGMKWNTIASTRELGEMSNEELTPTYNQIENWQASTAYSQNLYGKNYGQLINPENLGNTAYGSNYVQAMSILFDIDKLCGGGVGGGEKTRLKADYQGLKVIIASESNGKFISAKDFGLEQLMIGVIRTGAGASVSGLEQGPQNFNNQSQGFRSLSNQYMAKIGGRFLNDDEATEQELQAENTRRELEQKNGLAYRLFDENNIRSLANVLRYQTPRTKNEFQYQSKQTIAQISNPIKLLADLHSSFSYVALGKMNTAFAASETGDEYMRLDTVGLPLSEVRDTDWVKNSNEIQDLKENGNANQKKVLGYFDKCSKANIPTKTLFARLYKPQVIDGADKSDIAKLLGDDDISVVDETKALLEKATYEGVNQQSVEIPKYPAISVGLGSDDRNKWSIAGFSNKEEFIACEIYMMPPNNKAAERDYPNDKLEKIFGSNVNVRNLAKKYHLYLYANSIVDMMVELSNTEYTTDIYSNPSAAKDNSELFSPGDQQ